jgi:CHAD domain-containing protein
MRLYRPAAEATYQEENAAFRDAARRLASLRDSKTLVRTARSLADSDAPAKLRTAVDRVCRTLEMRRNQEINNDPPADARLDRFRDDMQAALQRAERWNVGTDEGDTILAGAKKTYRRARRAMKQAFDHPNMENLHEWRKRVKYHWYHARLLRDAWKEPMKARRDELDDLSDLLGDEHDLAVLSVTLTEDPELRDSADTAVLLPIIEDRRGRLQAQAQPLGERLFLEKPKHFAGRLGSYWQIWRAAG